MIRVATPQDAAAVAPLVIQAMGTLTEKFTLSTDPQLSQNLFEYFFKQEDNQYSYTNALVYEEDGQILGSILVYDGAQLHQLRAPFTNHLKVHFDNDLPEIEDETQAGEFYLDVISVYPQARGKGIASKLILAAQQWGRELGHSHMGLLVDTANEKALKLYQRLNFKIKGNRLFVGGQYHHMQYEL